MKEDYNKRWAGMCVHKLKNRGIYSDSYGSKGISDYVDMSKEWDKPKYEGPLKGYTERQRRIILGTLREKDFKVCCLELERLLNRANRFEDETVINIVYEKYGDILAEGGHKPPELSAEEFNDLLENFPEFEMPYVMKEAFRDIYMSESRQEAEESFVDWVATCRKEKLEGYDPFISTVENWHKEIFNYFDYPYTNAQTESLNNTIKELDREGRGYSFDVLRDKIVLKHLVKSKKKRGKFEF